MNMKEYKLNIDPRILELLGPSLYTNIYYIIAELIANAYDADAHNVYIIDNGTNITVEDDGNGMSYVGGEIGKYPLDDESQWHISFRDSEGNLAMSRLSCDIFAQKIEVICEYLGYEKRDRESNKKYLETLVKII